MREKRWLLFLENLYVLQARSDGEFDLVEYISPTPVEVMLSQLVSITKHN